MKRRLAGIALALALVACMRAPVAHAITIALEPSSATVAPGEAFDVALTISDLGTGATPSVGVYDIDILFDSAVIGLTGVTFGDSLLGDQLALVFPSLPTETPIAGGVNLFELSLDEAVVLAALQAPTFTLATLHFEGATPGATAITASVVTLGDEYGLPLTVDGLLGSGVTVVPEPSVSALVALGLALLSRRPGHPRRR